MIIALQPSQISIFWPNIKEAYLKNNPPPKGVDEYEYSNKVLENLLTQKYICWLGFTMHGEEKVIHGIGISSIERDPFTGLDTLHILSLYGYRRANSTITRSVFDDFMKYAKNTSCSRIKFQSTHKRLLELAQTVGFKKLTEVYTLDIGG